MSKDRKTASKRLATAVERTRREFAERAQRGFGKTITSGDRYCEDENWLEMDRTTRGEHADCALTAYRSDRALLSAFERFGLNDRNPYHWRLLLDLLARIHFEPDARRRLRSGGRTAPKWRGSVGKQLIAEVAALRQGRRVKLIAVLADLQKLRPQAYGRMKLEDFERRYHDALKYHDREAGRQ